MRSWIALIIAGTLIGPVAGSTVAYADTLTVSAQVETIVDAAYDQWLGSLEVRQSCSSGVAIVYEVLDGRRGEYRTQTGEVVIDPTDSVVGMGAIVVHELSHHTFLACGVVADAEFAHAFYWSQGLPEERDWFDYSVGWSATPAEHFAEAMAITITGTGEGGISVGTTTTALISRWLAGASSTPPADSYEPVPYSPGTGSVTSVMVDQVIGQPFVDPEPIAESLSAAIPATVEIYGETVQLSRTSTSVFWLNSWRVIRPI